MFLVGLSFRRAHFHLQAGSAVAVSLCGIIVPFLGAVALTPWLSAMGLFGPTVTPFEVAVVGGAAAGLAGQSRAKAMNLALGIGLQNFPEGLAVSMPLKRAGLSSYKAFLFGQLSGVGRVLPDVRLQDFKTNKKYFRTSKWSKY